MMRRVLSPQSAMRTLNLVTLCREKLVEGVSVNRLCRAARGSTRACESVAEKLTAVHVPSLGLRVNRAGISARVRFYTSPSGRVALWSRATTRPPPRHTRSPRRRVRPPRHRQHEREPLTCAAQVGLWVSGCSSGKLDMGARFASDVLGMLFPRCRLPEDHADVDRAERGAETCSVLSVAAARPVRRRGIRAQKRPSTQQSESLT
jgi:hypothetical protein